MASVISHNLYTGTSPTVTLTGGASVIVMAIFGSGGNGNAWTAATLNGVAGTLVGSSVNSGGEEAVVSIFTFAPIAAGSYAVTTTRGEFSLRSEMIDIWELSGASAPLSGDFGVTIVGGGASGSIVTHSLADSVGESVIAFGVAADAATVTGGSVADNESNLTSFLNTATGYATAGSGFQASVPTDPEVYGFQTFESGGLSGGSFDRRLAGALVIPSATPTVSIDSISDSSPAPGDTVTINLLNANATGKTVTYNGHALTIDSQNASTITVTWPYPWELATADVDFNTDYVLEVDDDGNTDTIDVHTAPAAGEDYHVITGEPWDSTSIYENDAGLANGDKHWGYQSTGTGLTISTSGQVNNAENGDQYRYRLFDVSAGLWGSEGTLNISVPSAPSETPGSMTASAVSAERATALPVQAFPIYS